MGDNIWGESFLRGNFPRWNLPGVSSMDGNFLGGSFSRGNFNVNTYAPLMKLCCQNETLMLQINTNLTVCRTAYHK